MPCFRPLGAWRGRTPLPSGKQRIVWRKEDSCGVSIQLPCGQCIGCRLERSRQWAVRCIHEASLHEANCFITLTYDDAHLPYGGTLVKRDFQLFLKRMRKAVGRFKFFQCGEYGDMLSRPHYHACIFGYDFPDRSYFKTTDAGEKLFTSDLLDGFWSLGYGTIGNVTFESAAYVARYVCKKVTGDLAEEHYMRLSDCGEVVHLLPEYVTMSRGGRTGKGLSYDWFQKFGNEVYPSDEVIARGFPCKPPRYYDSILEASEPSVFDLVKRSRRVAARETLLLCDRDGVAREGTAERRRVHEKCVTARFDLFKRPLE